MWHPLLGSPTRSNPDDRTWRGVVDGCEQTVRVWAHEVYVVVRDEHEADVMLRQVLLVRDATIKSHDYVEACVNCAADQFAVRETCKSRVCDGDDVVPWQELADANRKHLVEQDPQPLAAGVASCSLAISRIAIAFARSTVGN